MQAVNTDSNNNPFSALVSDRRESTTPAESADGGLGQTDFIELMLAQVKNQDPTKPLDPNQFMSQLAQFSTVNGIRDLQQSFEAFSNKLSSDQVLQAATLVGRDVMVPAGSAVLASNGELSGQIILPSSASNVGVKIYNDQGVLVRNLSLGGQAGGRTDFIWDGLANDGSTAVPGPYHVIAEALVDGSLQALETELQVRVESVAVNPNGGGTQLNLVSGESVSLGAIQKIK